MSRLDLPRAVSRDYSLVRVFQSDACFDIALVKHRRIGRLAIFKTPRADAGGKALSASMKDEAELLGALIHPNVVLLFDFDVEDGRPFLITEFVEGETLAARAARLPPLSEPQILRVAIQVLDGLRAIRKAGGVHRDLHPGNILLSMAGRPKLTNVCIAPEVIVPSGSLNARIAGTPEYLSPEQCHGKRATPSSNVYAMAVIVFELIAGRLPFTGPSAGDYLMQHADATIPRLGAYCQGASPAVEEVLMRALAKDPMRRTRDERELRRQLVDAYKSLEITAAEPGAEPDHGT